jgi:hypothetical protein
MNPPPTPPEESRWAAELDRRLKDLPDRRAPATLAPRVMAAVRARAASPWYRRTWWQWPALAQGLSLLVFSALLGGLTWVCLHAGRDELASSVGSYLTEGFAVFAPLWSLLATLVEAFVLVLKQVPLLAWAGVAAFFSVMYLSCIGLGTALYRIALPRRNS